jgi:methylated-DNA-[protein]-cysteine S-methyltransferase
MTEERYHQIYLSPIGEISLVANSQALLGAWFHGQKYQLRGFEECVFLEACNPVLQATCDWLTAYFSGIDLPALPPLNPQGTEFQQKVWRELLKIDLGQTSTYGQIAKSLNCKSAQAIGGAVGKNPISILIPCHRILGSDASLTGYAGGLERKLYLLALENERNEKVQKT